MHWPQVLKRFGQGPSTSNINLKMHLMLTQTLMFWNVKLFAYSNKHFPDLKKKIAFEMYIKSHVKDNGNAC